MNEVDKGAVLDAAHKRVCEACDLLAEALGDCEEAGERSAAAQLRQLIRGAERVRDALSAASRR